MHPILVQLGPLTVMTHDAFTVLALTVGLAIYYRELRRRGGGGGGARGGGRWGGPAGLARRAHRLDLAGGGPRRRDRRPRDHLLGAPRGLRGHRRPAVQRGHRA